MAAAARLNELLLPDGGVAIVVANLARITDVSAATLLDPNAAVGIEGLASLEAVTATGLVGLAHHTSDLDANSFAGVEHGREGPTANDDRSQLQQWTSAGMG